MPDEDSYLKTEKEMIGEVDVLLGGRAAEVVAFDGVSTGASNDLMRATEIVRRMITDYGMSDRFRNVALTQHGAGYGAADPKLVRDYSEQTQQYIDEEIARIINIRFEAVKARLAEKKQLLDYISGRLLEKEIMEGAEFASIIAAESSLPKSDAGGPAAV